MAQRLFGRDADPVITGAIGRPAPDATADAVELAAELSRQYWRAMAGERHREALERADAMAAAAIAELRALTDDPQVQVETALVLQRSLVEARQQILNVQSLAADARLRLQRAGVAVDGQRPPDATRLAPASEVAAVAGTVRLRLAEARRALAFAEEALDVQARILRRARATHALGKTGRHVLTHEELLAIVAEARRDLAQADLKGAEAGLVAAGASPLAAAAR